MQTVETIGSFESDVRVLLRDPMTRNGATVTPVFSTEIVLDAVKEAINHLHAERHSTRYVDGVISDPVWPDAEDLADFAVTYDERWRYAITRYAAALVYETGAPDAVNLQLAQTFRQIAEQEFHS